MLRKPHVGLMAYQVNIVLSKSAGIENRIVEWNRSWHYQKQMIEEYARIEKYTCGIEGSKFP